MVAKKMLPGQACGLVCADDTHEMHGTCSPLTRVRYDRLKMGQHGADMMLALLKNKTLPSVCLTGHWIEGTTLPDKSGAL